MTPGAAGAGGEPAASEVLETLGEAASQLGAFCSHLLREQPAVALGAALAAGFVTGGGLISPIGARLTATVLRGTLGNVATLVALDLVRRGIGAEGDLRGSAPGAGRR